MNPDFSFITSVVVSGYAVYQANSCSPLVQQVSVSVLYTGWWWRYYAFGGVLMGGSGTLSCKTDYESCKLSEHHCGSVASLHVVYLPKWKWNLPEGQRPVSQGSDCVGVVLRAYS
ncbi:hypothetical protein AVEN_16354-1 [Araneus ventricosus]|uniref:Uncharacterized protein n=1 Tax=Araneus ventricosus TaxID=182803 RepID=A0A4Y2GRU6_ARAVE|nr:hypothetical protein AVEN_16354-1 [Araneus ventricosus]